MSDDYPEVNEEDFTKLTIEKQPHQLIENRIIELGGGGVGGTKFKNEMMKYAGWSGDRLTSFAKDPKKAAAAFNKIRNVITDCSNADDLRSKIDPRMS